MRGSWRKAVQAAAEALLPTCADFLRPAARDVWALNKMPAQMSPIGRKYNPLFLPIPRRRGGVGAGVNADGQFKQPCIVSPVLTFLQTESLVNLAFKAKICKIFPPRSEFLIDNNGLLAPQGGLAFLPPTKRLRMRCSANLHLNLVFLLALNGAF